MIAITGRGVLFIFLIAAMYVFTLVLSFVVVGVVVQKLKLDRKIPPKRLNRMVYVVAGTIWLGFVFLALNSWAAVMWDVAMEFHYAN